MAGSRALEGIACSVFGMILFSMQDAMIKAMVADLPVWFLLVSRSIAAIVILVPMILILGAPHRLVTPLWHLHMLRGCMFAVGFFIFFASFPYMGFAEVTTIFFSGPLMVAVFAWIFLGEHIGPHRAGALIFGFMGVMISMNPTSDGFQMVALLPLVSAVLYAGSQTITRIIGTRDTTLTLGLYTLGFSAMVVVPLGYVAANMVDLDMAPHLAWPVPAMGGYDIVKLSILGTLGMAGYLLLSRAYQLAHAALVAPFDYTYLPFAALLGFFIFGEVPAQTTLIGMGMIILAGAYLGIREYKNAHQNE